MRNKRSYKQLANNRLVREYFTERRMVGEVPTELAEAVALEMEELSPLYKAVSVIETSELAARMTLYVLPVENMAAWDECGENAPNLKETLKGEMQFIGEVSGYRVVSVGVLPNCVMEGNENAIAEYVRELGRLLVEAVERAILNGDGDRKPWGIIPTLAEDHKKETGKTGAELYGDLIEFAAIADAKRRAATNEFHGVCNRKTAMKLLKEAGNTEAGAYPVVFPQLMAWITITEEMADGEILLGFMPVYKLYERKKPEPRMSDECLFAEDMTAFRTIGKYDGMPIDPDAFVHVKMTGI